MHLLDGFCQVVSSKFAVESKGGFIVILSSVFSNTNAYEQDIHVMQINFRYTRFAEKNKKENFKLYLSKRLN